MSKSKKIILYSILAIILIGGGFLTSYFSGNIRKLMDKEAVINQENSENNGENSDSFNKEDGNIIGGGEAANQSLSKLPESFQNLTFTDKYQKENYEKALEFEQKIKENPDNYYNYNSAGFWWKGLGDLTQNEIYFNRAIEIYSFAGKKFEDKKIFQPYRNLANIYIILKNYTKAEEAFKNAIRLAPEVGDLYIELANLYKDLMNKPQTEIIGVYEWALSQESYQPDVIYPAYAYYLCSIGKSQEAMERTKINCDAF